MSPYHSRWYCNELGSLVDSYMKERGISNSALAAVIPPPVLEFKSQTSTNTYISDLRRGRLYGEGITPKGRNTKNLRRTSIILYCMGIPEGHQIIARAREADLRFEYPPKEADSLAVIMQTATHGLEDRLALTSRRRKLIEGLRKSMPR